MLIRRLLLTLALHAGWVGCAHAEDTWFSEQFKTSNDVRPARTARTRPVVAASAASAASAATPVMPQASSQSVAPPARAWRTIVVPVPQTAMLMPASVRQPAPVLRPLTGYAHELSGIASYYWQEQMTSSGEHFDRHGMTAAHKTLPLGTHVRVTNLANGKSAVVRINDRGPFKAGRVIDLSEAAAQAINMTGPGLARVAIDVVR